MTAVQRAKERMDRAMADARGVIFKNDHPLAQAFDRAYFDWIRARWDDGDAWVRSVWTVRP